LSPAQREAAQMVMLQEWLDRQQRDKILREQYDRALVAIQRPPTRRPTARSRAAFRTRLGALQSFVQLTAPSETEKLTE
jgi:hypothetical protein